MSEFDKKMEEIFDVTPTMPEEKKAPVVLQQHYNEPDLKQDLTDAYQQSKENLQGIIDQGKMQWKKYLTLQKQVNTQEPLKFMQLC
jgi:hypothetical protein